MDDLRQKLTEAEEQIERLKTEKYKLEKRIRELREGTKETGLLRIQKYKGMSGNNNFMLRYCSSTRQKPFKPAWYLMFRLESKEELIEKLKELSNDALKMIDIVVADDNW